MPLFVSHHWSHLSYAKTGNEDEPGALSPFQFPSEETGGMALQGVRWMSCAGGRNHSETCAGCIVSCTTATNCSRNSVKSTSVRSVSLKAAKTLAASYLRR